MVRLAVSLVACALAMGSAFAETLRVGVFLHSPVVMQKPPNGEPYGPGVEYAKTVVRALGYEAKIELLPVSRILSYLSNGDLDMALEFAMNDERTAFALYPDKPCYVTHQALTVRSESPLKSISSVKDLSGMRIGYLLGAYPGSFFEGASDVTFDCVAGDTWIAQNLSKLLMGRVDAVLDQNEYSCLAEARLQGAEKRIRVIPLTGRDVNGYVVFSRARANAAELLRSYNALNGTSALADVNSLVLESLK